MQGENNLHNHQTGMCAAQNGLNALQLLPLLYLEQEWSLVAEIPNVTV